ncbi:hypothetical protein [Sorangium sp. So ce1335]|uniref:hypothetical protein n=1 Tax=Sorangium sp. So ce1335 TaxID=3133335 RepID=UPI003F5F6642
MDMLFGERLDFAIEADVEPNLEPPSAVWGRMCVWCRGVALGDLGESRCALYPAYRSFRSLPSNLDRLWSEELVGLDDIAAWNFLDGLLYGHHGDVEVPDDRTAEVRRRDWTFWSAHDFLTNWGEQFNGCKAFILCPPGGPVRILSRELPGHMGRGVDVSRAGLVAAVEGFTRWFEQQARRLEGGRA